MFKAHRPLYHSTLGLRVIKKKKRRSGPAGRTPVREREFFIDNLLVRIHFTIVMNRWTGLAPWEFEFPFPGSLESTFLGTWTVALGGLQGANFRPESEIYKYRRVCNPAGAVRQLTHSLMTSLGNERGRVHCSESSQHPPCSESSQYRHSNRPDDSPALLCESSQHLNCHSALRASRPLENMLHETDGRVDALIQAGGIPRNQTERGHGPTIVLEMA